VIADQTGPSVNEVVAEIAGSAGQIGELKSERIVHAFERQILSGRLAPGMRLPTESELSDVLGVSRSVVRDSVRVLVARGLVTVRQGRGTTVAEPSDVAYSNALLVLLTRSGLTMGDVYNARATLETTLVGLAAKNSTDADRAALGEAYERFRAAVARDDNEEAGASHAMFHARILEAVHQPALAQMLRPMADLTIVSSAASVLRTYSGDWEVEAHAPILEALKAGDPDAAARAVEAHYELATRPEPYQAFMIRPFADAYFSEEMGLNGVP
jgi:GntR family transcriptional repressor for pyruvate dehydrogenase complex